MLSPVRLRRLMDEDAVAPPYTDFRTRFGTPTKSDVGEVPKFWTELKKRYPGCEDLIDDPEQDGYGIGVLCWDGQLRESLLPR